MLSQVFMRIYLLLFALSAVACGTQTATTQQHANLCDPSACADPEPYGVPNWTCPDGSIGGPACIEADDGTCGWGIVECPAPDDCSVDECGPNPYGVPNEICPDGSIGGPVCARDSSTAACGWTIRECPEPAACAWDDCPAPAPGAPNYLCADGETIGGPACQPDPSGTCGWTFVECPTSP